MRGRSVLVADGLEDEYGELVPLASLPKVSPAALVDYLNESGDDVSLRTVATRLGIDPAVLCRPLTLAQADRYATSLGVHPGAVWGADWWRAERER